MTSEQQTKRGKRTGLSTSTVMLLPGVMFDMSAGAPMRMRCAEAEAARQARARKAFMSVVAGVEVVFVKDWIGEGVLSSAVWGWRNGAGRGCIYTQAALLPRGWTKANSLWRQSVRTPVDAVVWTGGGAPPSGRRHVLHPSYAWWSFPTGSVGRNRWGPLYKNSSARRSMSAWS